MLQNFSIRQRMTFILVLVACMLAGMFWSTFRTAYTARDMGILETGNVMFRDQKEKVYVATHSMALALGVIASETQNHDERVRLFRNMIQDIRFEEDKSGYYFIYDQTTNVALPTRPDLVGKDLGGAKDADGVYFVRELNSAAARGGDFVEYIFDKPGFGNQPKLAYAELIPGTSMWIGTGVYIDNIAAEQARISGSISQQVRAYLLWIATIAGFFAIFFFIIAILTTRDVVVSLKHTTRLIENLASGEGDLTRRMPEERKDETGEMALWINRFIEQIHAIISRIRENAGGLHTASGAMRNESEVMADGVRTAAKGTQALSDAASTMRNNMSGIAAAMEETSTNTSMVAAATEEMTSTIDEIAKNAEKARQTTGNAVKRVEETSRKAKELGDISREVGQVTQTIAEISAQTNLLALNATIEAARAGEAGKGFAVVASEIKDLATQTAKATENIRNIINHAQTLSLEVGEDVGHVNSAIAAIDDIVNAIATAVEEQSVATREIAGNVLQASQGIQEVNENITSLNTLVRNIYSDIDEVRSATTAITATGDAVNSQAGEIAQMAETLEKLVGRFKLS
ncbi:methyl-accepting chemotaxis protein [Desulfobotulus mexicanus]|uniref:Methyl-accepting chemotaxis protein n=1 Tax=Desulfobotulus mexicanus TaxID=2586642 RepID=A0A5S5MC27_9BACT|nr:methyl-accepting chemotaxis protein [Desulfobotulus mexicanus]TYT73274.1 methyl-accepting chemotaxis protein [Desulfobotulus mexicanus]